MSRSFVPSDNSSYIEYPPDEQTVESNREINNNNNNNRHHPFDRITTAATTSASTPNYHFENPSAASFTRRPPWFDDDCEDSNRSSHSKRSRSSIDNSSNSQSHHQHHYERKRSRHDDNEREQQYRSHHYQPYPNHRPTQIQATNPTPRRIPSFSRSFDNDSNNHHFHQQSTHSVTSDRPSIPSSTTRHTNEMTFEPTTHQSPLFHQTSMTTHIEQRPSSSFLLTDLLHRVIDAHASSYSDNHVHHHPTTASIDLIAYAWMSPGQEIFSLPAAFSIQFGDFFDLIIPDETPVVGLTDSELDRIPIMIYSNKISDDKCAVCLSEYINGDKLKHLKCKHYFHSECIDPWLKASTRCPICRGEQTN